MEMDEYTTVSLFLLAAASLLTIGGWAMQNVPLKLVGWAALCAMVFAIGGHAVWLAWLDPLHRWAAIVFFGVLAFAALRRAHSLYKKLPAKQTRPRGLSAELLKSSEPSVLEPRK